MCWIPPFGASVTTRMFAPARPLVKDFSVLTGVKAAFQNHGDPAGVDPDAEKRALEDEHCDPAAREPFIAGLGRH